MPVLVLRCWYIGPVVVGNVGDNSVSSYRLHARDECRLSAGWPPTLRPSQSIRAVSPPKTGSYRPQLASSLLLLLSP